MAGREIFLIPYSHLDTQWRWEYPTTIRKYLRATLDESLELFARHPEHQFNFTGTLRYEMMKDYFPERFEEVRRLVAEGRWHPSGTCLDETDALVPSVESMVRNILYGHRWTLRELGRDNRDYMIPDCFGFPANMPTVLNHCGITGFSSAKLTWGSSVGVPFELGMWRGPDGSEIASALNPCRYDSHLELPIFLDPFRLARLERLGRKNGVWKSFQYYGVGDIGGSPTEGSVRRAIASMRHYARKAGDLVVRQGSSDSFFRRLTAEEKERFGRYEGDFLLTKHSAGSVTSAAIMKRWNRKNEQLAFAAEVAAATAAVLAGAPYPAEAIEAAWKRVIACQMHDILPGTSTPTAYEFAHNDEVVALNLWSGVLRDAAEAMASVVPGDGDILLYNPAPEEREDPVEIELSSWDGGDDPSAILTDAAGKDLPTQLARRSDGRWTATFAPRLAPLGWSRWRLGPAAGAATGATTGAAAGAAAAAKGGPDPVRLEHLAAGYALENAALRVFVAGDGRIASVTAKDGDRAREILARPLAYEFQKERPFEFPAWNMDWRDRRRKPARRIEGGAEVTVLEEGPVRTTLRLRFRVGDSTIVRDVSLAAGGKTLDFTERIEWRERGVSLKLALDPALESPEVTSNWESARVPRGVNHKRLYEFPSRLWVDISDARGGVSILEDSKYGWDRPAAGRLRMTLLHTPAIWYVNGFWDQRFHDWGSHTVRWSLFPHEGDRRGVDSMARRHNQPVQAFSLEGSGARDAAAAQAVGFGEAAGISLLEVSDPQVAVLAVKKTEEGDGILVRLCERRGLPAAASLRFARPLRAAREVNGLEESLGTIAPMGDRIEVVLPANGVAAFVVEFADSPPTAPSPSFRIEFPRDTRMAGRAGEPEEAGESGAVRFPIELLPPTIRAGGLEFALEEVEGRQALACAGQPIDLPSGATRLSLLACAREDLEARFEFEDLAGKRLGGESLSFPAMSGFLGQWDRRLWKRRPRHAERLGRDYAWLNPCVGVAPGYVKPGRLAWFSTHVHDGSGDLPYRFGYLHLAELAIPEGARRLVLPKDGRLLVAAMAASNPRARARSVRRPVDAWDS